LNIDKTNFGDRVDSMAQQIATRLDAGDSKGVFGALQHEASQMSNPEWARLLKKIKNNELPGIGLDLDIITDKDRVTLSSTQFGTQQKFDFQILKKVSERNCSDSDAPLRNDLTCRDKGVFQVVNPPWETWRTRK
jgi:hypothetical protein